MGTRSIVIDIQETCQQISLSLKKVSFRYLDQFVKLKCGPDLLQWGVFPNAKEITEAMGTWTAVRKYRKKWLGDGSVCCYVIGDGKTPRLGALVTCLSRWQVYSIDPNMRDKYLDFTKVKRLTCIKSKAEDVFKRFTKKKKGRAVILACHSHAKLDPIWKSCIENYDEVLAVAIPCCVPQEIENYSPLTVYDDWGINSPCRQVKVWTYKKENGNVTEEPSSTE